MKNEAYNQLCNSFRQLTDVRFKLLALVPSISGAAIALISTDLVEFKQTPLPRCLVAVLGFIVTLGIVFYDQRNSQIYNAIVRSGRKLEDSLGVQGAFSQRPPRALRFLGLFSIWHDRGLALIYGSVLGGWVFPITCGVLWMIPDLELPLGVPLLAAIIALVVGVGSVYELHRLDRQASSSPQDISGD